MSPVSTGPQPLGTLLSSALSFVQTYMKPVLIGAVIFGTLASLLGGGVAHRAAYGVEGMMNEMGIDAQQMENLTERMRMGDESAAAEMERVLGDRLDGMNEAMAATMGARMLGMFAPLIGVAVLVGMIIAIFSHAYFLLLALSPTQDFMSVLRQTPKYFFPLLGLGIWMFLRSFIWIPIIGFIPAVILGPRFVASSVIMVSEKRGIMDSVSQSYARTKGYWGKIVGNLIVAALCVMLASIVAGIVTGLLGLMVPFAGVWSQAVVKEVFTAFGTVFAVQLALTVIANPLMAVPVAAVAPAKKPKKKA